LFAFAIGCTLVSLAAIELLYQTRARRERRNARTAAGPRAPGAEPVSSAQR
jgi:hypothetical protein